MCVKVHVCAQIWVCVHVLGACVLGHMCVYWGARMLVCVGVRVCMCWVLVCVCVCLCALCTSMCGRGEPRSALGGCTGSHRDWCPGGVHGPSRVSL